MRLFFGGSNGLVLYEDEEITVLHEEPVSCLVRLKPSLLVAGCQSGVVLVSDGADARVVAKDLGDGIQGMTAAANGNLYAGVSPAGIWRSKDLGATWSEVPSFSEVDGRESWTAPWGSPWVTALTAHCKDPKTIYCGVEVGGLYRTRDSGKKWFDLELPCPDVHCIQSSPAKQERVFVTTGGGAFCSDDEGFSWRAMASTRRAGYTMGLSAHPTEAERVIISATPGPPPSWTGTAGAGCEVHLSTDSGRRFRTVAKGLTGAVQRKALVINPRVPSEVAFGTSDGNLWYSNDGGESFDQMATDLGDLKALLFA